MEKRETDLENIGFFTLIRPSAQVRKCSSTLLTGSQAKVNLMTDRSRHFFTVLLQLLLSSSIKEIRGKVASRADPSDLRNVPKN